MTVRVNKSAFNIREKLSELERPIGVKGNELMRAETAQDARDLVSAGRKNLVINGDMRIDQRNNGSSVSLSTAPTTFICDRFLFEQGAASSNASTAQRVTDSPDDFFHSIKFTRGAASFTSNGWSAFNQRIEGLLLSQFAWGTSSAKPVTLSFWVKSTTPGIYSLNMTHYDGSSERWNVQEYNINSANTWEYKTLTFVGDTTSGFGSGGTSGWMRLYWHIGGDSGSAGATTFNTWAAAAGGIRASTKQVNLYNISGATFQITGVQLEVGKNATEFEHRSYGEELALCQRYYWRVPNARWLMGYKRHDSQVYFQLDTPVPMRASPTPTIDSVGTFTNHQSALGGAVQTTCAVFEYRPDAGRGTLRVDSTYSGTHTTIPSWEAGTIEFSAEL